MYLYFLIDFARFGKISSFLFQAAFDRVFFVHTLFGGEFSDVLCDFHRTRVRAQPRKSNIDPK